MGEKSWFNITTENADETEIVIYDEIGDYGVSASSFISQLQQVDPNKPINLRLNSVGGSIVDGLAMITALKRHAGGVTAWVDGIACSMASAIACAMPRCFIAEGGMLMIHRASTVAVGDAQEIRGEAALLERFENSVIKIYADKTGMSDDEVRGMLDPETWMDAVEAIAMGFADAIAPQSKAVARVDLSEAKSRFQNFMQNKTSEAVPADAVDNSPTITAEAEANLAVAKADAENFAYEVENLREENKSLKALVESAKASNEEVLAGMQAKLDSLTKANGVAVADEVPAVAASEIFDPVEAFKAASKAGDYKRRDSIYAEHHKVIWAAR
tara:strand:- start:36 stop:1022 length:987 start_codon:yes stop_codon:yes gene_type:complete